MVVSHAASNSSESLRLSAWLLLIGQVLYIAATRFHTGGDANDHVAVFAAYAASGSWTAVHLAQFASMAILLAGLFALSVALDAQAGSASSATRFGAALAAVTLGLYGVLQAVDGVALKQAVDAWTSAPEPEKAARFASAEGIRWLEWGVRSYQNFALGLALFVFAAAVLRTVQIPRAIAYLMGLSGIAHFAQGWLGGTDGFSRPHSTAIVLAWALNLAWMIWLIVAARAADALSDGQGER
jgi:hypothetical protein